MNFRTMTDVYFRLHEMVKNEVHARHSLKTTRKFMTNQNVLTSEQKKKIKDLYGPYAKIGTLHHAFYTEKTGVFDPRWLPSDLYYREVDRHFNPMYSARVLDNKCLYERLFPGIPQAEAIAYQMGEHWYNGQHRHISKEEAKMLVEQDGVAFVKAATTSCGGSGVIYIDSKKGSVAEQFDRAVAQMADDFVIQKPICQHSTIAKLNAASVNTLRLCSVLRQDGVKIYSAIIRMGVGDAKIDNASAGGIFCGIREDGTLRDTAYRLTGESFKKHPTSGVVFDGYQLEGYDKARELAMKAHLMVPHFHMVSWDVVIDEQGQALMLEVNLHRTGIESLQLANGPLFGEDTEKVLAEIFGKGKR